MSADKTVKVSVPEKRYMLTHINTHTTCIYIFISAPANTTMGSQEAKQHCKLWLVVGKVQRDLASETHSG